MAVKVQIQNGAFQDAAGVAIVGTLILQLSQDAVVSGTGQVAPKAISIAVVAGQAAATPVWGNDNLTPSGTVYVARLFDTSGAPVWGPENWSITGAGPIEINTLVPAAGSVSYAGAVILAPSGDQTITTNNLLPASGNTTQRLGSSSARWVGLFNSITASAFNSYIYVDGNTYALTRAGIQAALDQASANGGGTVVLPPGSITMGTTGLTLASGVGLVGAGMNQTILTWTAAINAINMVSPVGCLVRDLAIKFTSSPRLAGVGLRLSGSDAAPAFNNVFENILIDFGTLGAANSAGIFATTTGPSQTNIVLNRFENIVVQTADAAVIADGCEGNHWNITAMNIGASVGQTIFKLTGFNADEVGDLRLETGSGNSANIIGLGVSGNNNMFRLVVDGESTTTALNDTGGYNIYDITTIGSISSIGTVPATSIYRWASANQSLTLTTATKLVATNGDSGLTPSGAAHAIIGNANTSLGSGTGKVYGVVGVARGSSDVVGDRAYGGWFKATAGAQTTTEVGLHSESADSSGTAAEFGSGGTVFTSISGAGALTIGGATPTGTGTQLGVGNTTGFGNGTAGTTVTTTLIGTGSGPATPQTVKKYLEIDIGGTKFWIPLVQ
jgi:hypothetical protein